MGAEFYEINPERCTECVGHFDEPQCALLCPVDCIPQGAEESHAALLGKIPAAGVKIAPPPPESGGALFCHRLLMKTPPNISPKN